MYFVVDVIVEFKLYTAKLNFSCILIILKDGCGRSVQITRNLTNSPDVGEYILILDKY